MDSAEEILEYELIDISIETGYILPEDEITAFVREDVSGVKNTMDDKTEDVCDADGIPMGSSMEDIRKRETIIADFLSKWRETNTEGKVLNDALEDYIYFRNLSFTEAKEHSSKSYNSTRAVMILDEVLKNASPIKRVPIKTDDQNQKDFEYLLVMLYKHPDIGSIKLTIGIKKRSHMKIQYGISALKPDEPLVDYSQFKRKKKRSSRK